MAEKAGLVWTVHHYAPFTPQVSDVVSYGVTYFTGLQRLLLKGVTLCCYMCSTAVWDTKYSGIILNFSFCYHLALLRAAPPPPLMYTINLACPLLKCKTVQSACQSMMRLCVFKNVCCELCPVLTSRTKRCFYSCISCVSSPRCQDWWVREKEPSTEDEWDWSFARQPQLEATIPMIFFFFSKKYPTPLPPSKLSTVHPPCIHFWTCTDNRICGEMSKRTAPCCNVRRGLVWTQIWITTQDEYQLQLHCQHFNMENKSPFVNLSSGTNHSWIFLLFVCKVPVFLSSLVNCQMQGFRIWIWSCLSSWYVL